MNGFNKDCLIYKYLMYAVVDFSEHGQSMDHYFDTLNMPENIAGVGYALAAHKRLI